MLLTRALASIPLLLLVPAATPPVGKAPDTRADRIATVTDLDIPESARYDPDQDVYFVSVIGAHPTALDNNGAIVRIGPDGTVLDRSFIVGGRRGVTLHAPKGMVIRGDELWVTDVTVVRAFHRRTGAPMATIDLAPLGPLFLNDIAAGPDGTLYISDTGLMFGERVTRPGPDRIYRIRPGQVPELLVADSRLAGANGVFWDAREDRLLIASLSGRSLWQWTPTGGVAEVATGPGGYDGIERLPDGRIVVSSQNANGVAVLNGDRLVMLFNGAPDTGDIGVDTRRTRVAIPRLDANVMEIWQLP